MNQDDRERKDATKHYQNPDYPAGSVEAAIQDDHDARLRETSGLRLERHPAAESNPREDIEEMVPAFMHRDFFRSEEDASDAPNTGSSRLKVPRREKGPIFINTPSSGYIEPPVTESDDPSPTATPAAPPAPVLKSEPRPLVAPKAAPEPLAPLRSLDAVSAAGTSVPAAAGGTPALSLAGDTPAPTPGDALPAAASAAQTPASPATSGYSIPMLVALALVMGLFVWREQTRPIVVVQAPLPVPTTVLSEPSPTPLAAAPTEASPGFRPTFLAVGPPIPQEGAEAGSTPDASGQPGGEGLPVPADSGADDDGVAADEEAAERAAILNRMSEPSTSKEPASEGGGLFPETAEASAVPVRAKSPANGASGAVPKAEPQAEPIKTNAADLFPIDEELPVKPPGKPSVPEVAGPPPATNAAPPANSEPYQIDEPSL